MAKIEAEKKEKKKTSKQRIEMLEEQVKYLTKTALSRDNDIIRLRQYVEKVETKLKFYIDKQTSEIRVLEKDGKWGGYTGVFYVDSKDKKEIITSKAMNHYKRYFENNSFYENRTLGLFIRNPKGRKLVKVLQDNEGKANDGMVKYDK